MLMVLPAHSFSLPSGDFMSISTKLDAAFLARAAFLAPVAAKVKKKFCRAEHAIPQNPEAS
jgi:hypothetical protein